MPILTMMHDKNGLREAWQNGKRVYIWSEKEVAEMAAERNSMVPPYGAYAGRHQIPASQPRCLSNGKGEPRP